MSPPMHRCSRLTPCCTPLQLLLPVSGWGVRVFLVFAWGELRRVRRDAVGLRSKVHMRAVRTWHTLDECTFVLFVMFSSTWQARQALDVCEYKYFVYVYCFECFH